MKRSIIGMPPPQLTPFLHMKSHEVLSLFDYQGLTKVGVGSLTRGCLKLYELNISWTDLDEEGLKVNLPMCYFHIILIL